MIFNLEASILDPFYDYDFTLLKDDGRVYKRGGRDYIRPYGWRRIALNVRNKFETDAWLGWYGSEGEWAVSYHGTSKEAAEEISKTKYDLSKGKRFAYGVGIYSSPDPEVAERYSKAFLFQGKNYKVILQNRVNMQDTEHVAGVNYFLTKNEKNIRPYGILFKKI